MDALVSVEQTHTNGGDAIKVAIAEAEDRAGITIMTAARATAAGDELDGGHELVH
jgi:hypothetical protein